MGGTGGTKSPGDPAFARLVTPGIYAIWIMFDALVSTVDAIDCTVCTDALSLRCIAKSLFVFSGGYSSHSSSIGCLRPFRQNFHSRNEITDITRIPPTTPPTIAPMFGPLDLAVTCPLFVEPETLVLTHCEKAHRSQDCAVWEQTSSPAQDGQGGTVSGHCTHRLKRLCGERSESASPESAYCN